MFRRNELPPSSALKSKPSKQHEARDIVPSLAYSTKLKNWGYTFLRNVGEFLLTTRSDILQVSSFHSHRCEDVLSYSVCPSLGLFISVSVFTFPLSTFIQFSVLLATLSSNYFLFSFILSFLLLVISSSPSFSPRQTSTPLVLRPRYEHRTNEKWNLLPNQLASSSFSPINGSLARR